jgi:7-cyano-7-deazaguanine synthase in queuosine biosynthesis
VNAVDYSGYPDCRPKFIEAFQALANLATKAGVEGHEIKVHAPLINMSKGDENASGIDCSTNPTFSSLPPKAQATVAPTMPPPTIKTSNSSFI